jgi:DNA-binding NtrC family response regulator
VKFRLLLVDDDALFLDSLKSFLERHDYGVECCDSASGAVEKVQSAPHAFSLVILDYNLGGKNGATLAQELRALNPDIFILILSADPTREALKATWKAGVLEFIDKNIELPELLKTVEGWCKKYEETHLPAITVGNSNENEKLIQHMGMIGKSNSLAEVWRKVQIFQSKNRNVLVLGESGTGKEMIAKAIHAGRGDFRAINCASYRSNPTLLESALFGHVRGAFTGAERDKKGAFEEVCGGTIFLDEIHHLSSEVQVSILRALQEKKITPIGSSREIPVRFRLVAAAKPDLEDEVKKGTFRLDLLYRIKGATIILPALRERPEDIEPLVAHFTKKWAEENRRSKVFLSRTVRYLERYTWPGNVRELEHTVFELLDLVNKDKITPEDLDSKFFVGSAPSFLPDSLSLKDRMEQVEISHVRTVMEHSRSLRDAARKMDITPQRLLRLIKKYNLRNETRTTPQRQGAM